MSRHLPASHRCRTDDLAYTTVIAWWEAHQGRMPIQAPAALSRYMQLHGCTFAEAWTALTGPRGPIILVEDEPPSPTEMP